MSLLGRAAARKGRYPIGAYAVCALVLGAVLLDAQQPPPAGSQPPEVRPEARPSQQQYPQQTVSQQPGAGAQVHTGTTSGLDTEARLRNLLADHQFLLIESQLDKMAPTEAQFYRGILANRENDPKASAALLEPLVDQVAASGDKAQEKLVRKALAEDYLRLGDWQKAAKAYQTLSSRLEPELSPDERDEIEMPLKLLPLAQANPPMTVEPCDPFVLQVSRNPLGLTDIPVFVDARPHTWMLDPTAPFNLISRSLAKEAGLKVSDEASTIHTLTGRPIQVHVTVIPRFTVGGRLTLRNMTAFVYEDADYFFPKTHYQVEGVLGYPALSALGSLTITANATIEVRPATQIQPPGKDDRLTTGARFFLDGDQVIVALGNAGTAGGEVVANAGAQGVGQTASQSASQDSGQDASQAASQDASQERMFAVDAGGQQTYLTSRYYDEHAADFAGQKMELFAIPGSEKLSPQPAYVAETIPLMVGPTTVQMHYVQVLTQPVGSAVLDDVYGVLGIDALDQLKSYTFDYRTMRFGVRTE
jgi:hypothetical protein